MTLPEQASCDWVVELQRGVDEHGDAPHAGMASLHRHHRHRLLRLGDPQAEGHIAKTTDPPPHAPSEKRHRDFVDRSRRVVEQPQPAVLQTGRGRQFESGHERTGADDHDPTDGRCLGADRLKAGPSVEAPRDIESERLADPPTKAVGGQQSRLLHVIAEVHAGERRGVAGPNGNRHHAGHPAAVIVPPPAGTAASLEDPTERPCRIDRADRVIGPLGHRCRLFLRPPLRVFNDRPRGAAEAGKEEIPPHRQIPTGVGRRAGDRDHLPQGLHEVFAGALPCRMTGEPISQGREPLDALGYRQHSFGGRDPLRDESVDLLSQRRRRAGDELPETTLHPSSFGDRHEGIGAIGHQPRILACRPRRGDIEAAAKRRPCRGNVAAAEMAVNDEPEHRSLRRRPRAIGKSSVPKRNGGGEIAFERRK